MGAAAGDRDGMDPPGLGKYKGSLPRGSTRSFEGGDCPSPVSSVVSSSRFPCVMGETVLGFLPATAQKL